MSSDYIRVNPDYYDIIEMEKSKSILSVVNYFGSNGQLEDVKSKIIKIVTNENNEDHLLFENNEKIRLDRIITINGKPGPAFDEYDSYALACLDCTGGMD